MNPPVIKDKKPRKRARYVTVNLTPNQVRLLYTELTNSAAACADNQLRREYEVLAHKFDKVREPR